MLSMKVLFWTFALRSLWSWRFETDGKETLNYIFFPQLPQPLLCLQSPVISPLLFPVGLSAFSSSQTWMLLTIPSSKLCLLLLLCHFSCPPPTHLSLFNCFLLEVISIFRDPAKQRQNLMPGALRDPRPSLSFLSVSPWSFHTLTSSPGKT